MLVTYKKYRQLIWLYTYDSAPTLAARRKSETGFCTRTSQCLKYARVFSWKSTVRNKIPVASKNFLRKIFSREIRKSSPDLIMGR